MITLVMALYIYCNQSAGTSSGNFFDQQICWADIFHHVSCRENAVLRIWLGLDTKSIVLG